MTDVEGIYVLTSGQSLSQPCALGYTSVGVDLNSGIGGDNVYVLRDLNIPSFSNVVWW